MGSRTRALVAALALVAAVAACGSSTPAASIADITGTWTGTGRYADVDGTIKSSPETFTVTKQDGALVWGTVEYANPDGSPVKEQVVGTFMDGGKGFIFTERTSLWQGVVSGNTMSVVVAWMGDPSHGAFEMTLTKK
jgi:hypothetical protein